MKKEIKKRIKSFGLSPLRYPGAKRKLFMYLFSILAKNKREPSVIIEPFVGGGSVFLNFLTNGIVEKAIIADIDKLISSFWRVVFFNSSYLIDFIKDVRITRKNFRFYKEIAKNSQDYNEEQLAEACFFLNRTSFSGILTDAAGPIGGNKQVSEYKIDCRFNRKVLKKKLTELSKLKDKVTVLSSDWKSTIEFVRKYSLEHREEKFFYYFDPPFYNKAPELYRYYFSNFDHDIFSKEILSLAEDWILSYDNSPEIKKLYPKSKRIHLDLPYSINSHAIRLEKELVITPLSLPRKWKKELFVLKDDLKKKFNCSVSG